MKFLIQFVYLIVGSPIHMIESKLVSVGKYPNAFDLNINRPECGFNLAPLLYNIYYPNTCFDEHLPNKTITLFDKYKKPIPSERIFQGQNAERGESPWTVMIKWPRFECTGVLITFQWILTSAHCYDELDEYKSFVVNIGTERQHFIEMRTGLRTNFYLHPKFTHPDPDPSTPEVEIQDEREKIQIRHDIALVKVNSPFNDKLIIDNRYLINTICLPQTPILDRSNSENAIIYGWGMTDDRDSETQHLQKGEVIIHPFRDCPIDELFCATFINDSRPRNCEGDSGGPLIQQIGTAKRNVLLGINKGFGPPDATCSHEINLGFWISVPHFIDWILKTIRENS